MQNVTFTYVRYFIPLFPPPTAIHHTTPHPTHPRTHAPAHAPAYAPTRVDRTLQAFQLQHLRPGTVSLAVGAATGEVDGGGGPGSGASMSGSPNTEFLITTGPAPVPSLDGNNIVFGCVPYAPYLYTKMESSPHPAPPLFVFIKIASFSIFKTVRQSEFIFSQVYYFVFFCLIRAFPPFLPSPFFTLPSPHSLTHSLARRVLVGACWRG